MADTATAEPPTRERPSSGKADRLKRLQEGTFGEGIGSGKVLGSPWTDTNSAEMGYGVDGKKEITFGDKKYIFAPVGFDLIDEALLDLRTLPPLILAIGMTKPLCEFDEVSVQDIAVTQRLLSNDPNVSETSITVQIAWWVYDMPVETRNSLCRLFWFSFRRWHPDIEYAQVLRIIDFSNIPFFTRLFFWKNIGLLDRFLHHLAELLPPAPVRVEADEMTLTPNLEQPVNPEDFANLMSAAGMIDAPPDETLPDQPTHEPQQEVPGMAIEAEADEQTE